MHSLLVEMTNAISKLHSEQHSAYVKRIAADYSVYLRAKSIKDKTPELECAFFAITALADFIDASYEELLYKHFG